MTLLLEPGILDIDAPTGAKVFSSLDGLFHVVNKLSGSQAIAALTFNDETFVDSVTSYLLGDCHPDCTDVIGSVKFTLNSYGAGLAFDRWHSVMGGDILWVIDGHGLTGTSPDPNTNMNQLVKYRFRVENGQVWLDRRAFCSNSSQGTYTVLSHTIEFKLKVGLYTV